MPCGLLCLLHLIRSCVFWSRLLCRHRRNIFNLLLNLLFHTLLHTLLNLPLNLLNLLLNTLLNLIRIHTFFLFEMPLAVPSRAPHNHHHLHLYNPVPPHSHLLQPPPPTTPRQQQPPKPLMTNRLMLAAPQTPPSPSVAILHLLPLPRHCRFVLSRFPPLRSSWRPNGICTRSGFSKRQFPIIAVGAMVARRATSLTLLIISRRETRSSQFRVDTNPTRQ